jgi:chemotaxis protein MotB
LQLPGEMPTATSAMNDVGDTTGLVDTGERRASRQARKAGRALAKAARARARDAARESAARRPGGRAFAPWVVTMAISAIAGFGGYYLFEKYQLAREALADQKLQAAAAMERAAVADDKVIAAEAELAHARGEFDAERRRAEAMAAEADDLAARLESLVGKDEGEVVRDESGRLSLQLVDKVLFRLGEADLTDPGKAVLEQVGLALNNYPDQQIWVQGHTDDVPIAPTNRKFSSNWELSAARALNVVHYLQHEANVDPRRLAAVAFSEYRPVARNQKWKNRRIEIVLAPREVRVIKD